MYLIDTNVIVNELTLATRNVADFQGLVRVRNPFVSARSRE